MVAASLVHKLSSFVQDLANFVPPGLFLTIAPAFVEGGKYLASFRQEFVGTLIMIVCTFSAGKWIGAQDRNVAWFAHFCGVIAADLLGGGPHVNPAVTVTMVRIMHAFLCAFREEI
jgi:hypothetical protein